MVPMVGIVDTAVMARMGSPAWVAATAVGAILFSSIYWVFGFLRMGTGGLVAQAFGANELDNAGRITIRALCIAGLLGAVLIVLQQPILHAGLVFLTDQNDWKELTAQYFNIRIYSAPATLMLYVVLGALIGLQKMRQVLLLQLLLNLLNIILTIGFFKYTQLGIAGVAYATLISEYVTVGYGLYLARGPITLGLKQGINRQWLFDPAECKKYFTISGDLFIRTLCLTLAFYWMTALGSDMGVMTLAVNTVLLHLVHFASYCMDGYAHAIESLTGYAVGRKSRLLFRKAVRASISLGCITAGLFALFFLIAGDSLIAIISPDPAVQAVASQWLPWVILAPVIGIWSFLLDGIFIGATETAAMRNGMIVSLLVFGITSTLLVPVMGNHGVWLSYHVLLVTRAATLLGYWKTLNHRFGDNSSA